MKIETRIVTAVMVVLALGACSKRDVLNGPGKAHGVDAPKHPVTLTVETPTELTLGMEEPVAIIARVTRTDTGEPAHDRPVKFVTSGSLGGSTLTPSGEILTGEDGRVQKLLTSGTNRTDFSIIVSTPQAEGQGDDPRVEITVHVDGTYHGQLQVSYTYDSPVIVDQIITRVHKGAANCAGISWPTQPSSNLVDEQTASSDLDTLVFSENLIEAEIYTVTASALGIAGQQIAVGCQVADPIIGRGIVPVDVELVQRPVKLTGTYDFGAELHFNEGLPGPVGDVLEGLEQLFTDPAQMLAEQITNAAQSQLGIDPAIIEGAATAAWSAYVSSWNSNHPGTAEDIQLDDDNDNYMVDDAIKFLLLDDAPGWVTDGLLVGGDVTGLMNHFTAGGELSIDNVTETGDFDGRWDWNDFLFTWRLNQGCDYTDTCCGRTEYSGEEMDLEPIGAAITGTLTRNDLADRIQYDMEIDPHQMQLQYGNIALFLVEHLILPAITGQTGIDCAVESLFGCNNDRSNFVCNGPDLNGDVCGCDRVGVWLAGFVSSFLALDTSVGSAACGLVLEAADSFATGLLNDLTFGGVDNGYLQMSVGGILADDDHNLATDLIDGGSSGDLIISSYTAAFTGEVAGTIPREACSADTTCEAFESCQLKTNVLNDCEGDTVCVQRVGEKTGGESCSQGKQCRSGVCLATNKCLEVCAQDTDCNTGLGCSDAPVTVPLGDLDVPVSACGM